jgi:hypothetical protein
MSENGIEGKKAVLTHSWRRPTGSPLLHLIPTTSVKPFVFAACGLRVRLSGLVREVEVGAKKCEGCVEGAEELTTTERE